MVASWLPRETFQSTWDSVETDKGVRLANLPFAYAGLIYLFVDKAKCMVNDIDDQKQELPTGRYLAQVLDRYLECRLRDDEDTWAAWEAWFNELDSCTFGRDYLLEKLLNVDSEGERLRDKHSKTWKRR